MADTVSKLTPMLAQYFAIKERHPDCILFFRMGDFYEMFFEDAKVASKALEITLTTRNHGMPEAVPLCGVPYHAADTYLARLVEAGFKVAICEQVEDPKLAKGVVRRAVTRVVTRGTALSPGRLPEKQSRYLAAVTAGEGSSFGLAYVDYSTGEFRATAPGLASELLDELARLDPAEIVAPASALSHPELGKAVREFAAGSDPPRPVTQPPEESFEHDSARRSLCEHFGTDTLEPFGVEGFEEAARAAGGLLTYLRETQEPDELPAFEVAGQEPISIPRPLSHITSLSYYASSEYMILDESSKRNLELVRTLRDSKTKGSLFWYLDRSITGMGGRTLLRWLNYPLLDPEAINLRLDAVEFAHDGHAFRLDLCQLLTHTADLERLYARAATGAANARDLIAIRDTLRLLPKIKSILARAEPTLLAEIDAALDPLPELAELLGRALVDDPPAALREGGLIRPGYAPEIDELEELKRDAKAVIARMEATERQRTGIGSLKVRYNKVFGYYLEVSNPNLALVPADYIRKQTLVNHERFITPELKELETKILGAEEKLIALHYELFRDLRDRVAARGRELQRNARELGRLDALLALAELASRARFCRPAVDASDVIDIKGGWHPVVAELVKGERFVPNDVRLDNEEQQLLIITGPNMAGKSTVLRQTALIVILAQMGSFVPAEEARIGVVDRVFTRVGASDVLVRGMSTFMVEMTEAANILHHATRQSLVLLDEIGRGTSTFDGLSIAWAVAEYLHDAPGHEAKTMFATHYHELTDLAETRPRIKNFHILVREWEGRIIFLRKLAPGSTSRSYGIQVAKLAGLPASTIERAREILHNLEAVEHDPAGAPVVGKSARGPKNPMATAQLNFFTAPANPQDEKILDRLRALDPESLTPMEALAILDELHRELKRK
jgi:DNA mismatch repair protein MutS